MPRAGRSGDLPVGRGLRERQRNFDLGPGQQHGGRRVRGHDGLAADREADGAAAGKRRPDGESKAVSAAGTEEGRKYRIPTRCSCVSQIR
jgi:hypothetical protein